MEERIKSTIEYYESNADEFFEGTVNADMSFCMDKFLMYVKPEGQILDVGCGSGRDSKSFKEKGYTVEAFDISEELCKRASEYAGIHVRCMGFQEFTEEDRYDGIWACASLLHVERAELPGIASRLAKGLKKDGIIYASFKHGDAERTKDGRFFTDMNEATVCELFENAGIRILECFVTGDVREDRAGEKWVNVIGCRL